jgi:hypothetical protein
MDPRSQDISRYLARFQPEWNYGEAARLDVGPLRLPLRSARETLAAVVELLRTNDPVLISYVEALLAGEGVEFFVADQHMSVLEGSLGFIRRRIMVSADDAPRARRALEEAGLGAELSPA